MNHRVLCLSLLLFLSVVNAAAQDNNRLLLHGRHDMGQFPFNTLSGTVRTLDAQPVRDARVEVRALGTGQTVASGYTLPSGSFEFDNLPHGIYEVVATVGVREARERVELHDNATSLQLLLPPDTGDTTGSGSTVSVSQLKVPGKARKLFAKAQELFDKQKLPQAREQVEKALQVFPNYAQALVLRGLINLEDNKVDAARADTEQAIKDDYSYAMSYVVLGAIYNLTNRYDDATRVLERGIVLQPASWQAYFELSKALLGKGQYAPALRQISKAADFAPPKFAPIHLVRAHALLGINDYNQAVTELEQFLAADPGSADSAQARVTLNQVRAFVASKGK